MRRSKYEGQFKKGDGYGYWRILNPAVQLDDRGRAYVTCQCTCGVISQVLCHHLKTGTSTKCNSCNKNNRYYIHNPNWQGQGLIPKALLSHLSSSAARKGIEYKITPTYANDLYASSGEKCAISGQALVLNSSLMPITDLNPLGIVTSSYTTTGSYQIPPNFVGSNFTGTTGLSGHTLPSSFVGGNATIARINPELGYVEGNVMWVHKSVEPMLRKSKTSSDEFIQMCLNVAEAHSQFRKGNSND